MRAASDVGGTFTDLAYYTVDEETGLPGAVNIVKTDTTPPRFEDGVMNSLAKADIQAKSLNFFAHGSTIVINALTERRGVKTALITTKGFRDVLEIGRGNRPDLFNFNFRKPAPFVERYLRKELTERTTFKGTVAHNVELDGLPDMLDFFRTEGVEAIAVCFLHAYVNPANEAKTVSEIRKLWPGISVIASHEVSREWREYERTNTTVLSAYVHPIAKKYIELLEGRLEADGFTGSPFMMKSNGGIATVEAAKRSPISMIESGPASGIYAAAYLGRQIGEPNLIVLDIGGTTAKCSLIENGAFKVTTEYYIERDRRHPGYPVQTPVSEIVEIGNGGGSIAWSDVGGKLHVGPRSAGAVPGPAAYGKGGSEPTTTDANLVLGRIDPESFVSGEIKPNWPAVEAAFAPLHKKLNMTTAELARGVVRIANANMTNALRLVSTNKGHDPREFALMAFGGGGAMHAVALAEELRVPRVIIPVNSSVFSAWGMLLADLRRDYIRTQLTALAPENIGTINETYTAISCEAAGDFARDGVDGMPQFTYQADMRYLGQEHTVSVPFEPDTDGPDGFAALAERFHSLHEKRFTYRLDNAIQIVNFHVVATIAVAKPDLAKRAVTGRDVKETIVKHRRVDYDQHGIHDAAIHDGLRMEPGMELFGPAVIQEPAVTLVVPPGKRVTVDDYGNYHIHLGDAA